MDRKEAVTSDNKALMLEQLREMNGQAVWGGLLDPTIGVKVYNDHSYAATQRWTREPLWYTSYGETWIAYRRPPGGEAK